MGRESNPQGPFRGSAVFRTDAFAGGLAHPWRKMAEGGGVEPPRQLRSPALEAGAVSNFGLPLRWRARGGSNSRDPI